jgi:hypothetical protein
MQCIATNENLPRLLIGTPNMDGILIGPVLEHIQQARAWAIARVDEGLADAVALVTSELVTNALKHTASGLPGGTTCVEIERTDRHLVLSVRDNGPRPGERPTAPTSPSLNPLVPGGNGLRLVTHMALYWDWTGVLGGPLTVRARFARLPATPTGPMRW